MLLMTFIAGMGTSLAITKVLVDPPEIIDRTGAMGPGSLFSVYVNVTEVTELYGWSFRMLFNPSILNVSGANLGTWLADDSGWRALSFLTIRNDLGYVFCGQLLDPFIKPTKGATGSGNLATISFEVVGIGATTLDLDRTALNTVISGQKWEIIHVAEDGLFDNRPLAKPPHADFEVKGLRVEAQPLTFNASASNDADDGGWIVSYEWDFGYDANHTDKWFAVGISKMDMWIGDGVTKSFFTTQKPIEGSEKVYVDESCTHDYTIDYETGNITLTIAPGIGATVIADYKYVGQKTFVTTEKPVIPGSEKVYVNQILMTKPDDYTIDYETGYITFATAPDLGAVIDCVYSTRAQGSGMTTTHAFPKSGNYTITLTVTDNNDLSDTATDKIEIVKWIVGGTFPDLVGWEAKPEYSRLNEGPNARGMDLCSLVGNPTEDTCEVYVEFTLFSKDEVDKLGTLSTETILLGPGEKTEMRAYFDASDPMWRCFSGSPEWVVYGIYQWLLHKYIGFASCYYKNSTMSGFVKGNVVKYISFNVVPMYHNIGVLEVTASPREVTQNGIIEINVTVTNKGELMESVNLDLSYVGIGGITGNIDSTPVTLALGENKTLTFTWDTTGLALGPYLINAKLPILPYEKAIGDNSLSTKVYIVPPRHDIAVTNVTAYPTTVKIGETVSINVTVRNEGSFAETFRVIVYYDSKAIGTKEVTDLAPGDEITLTFSWVTQGVKEGNYTIKAEATVVPEETDTADNICIGGVITVTRKA